MNISITDNEFEHISLLSTIHVIDVNQGFETDLKQSTLEIAEHLTDPHTTREDGNRPEYQRRKHGGIIF